MHLYHMLGIVNVSSDFHFSLLPLPFLPYCTSYILEGLHGKINAEESREHGGMGDSLSLTWNERPNSCPCNSKGHVVPKI